MRSRHPARHLLPALVVQATVLALTVAYLGLATSVLVIDDRYGRTEVVQSVLVLVVVAVGSAVVSGVGVAIDVLAAQVPTALRALVPIALAGASLLLFETRADLPALGVGVLALHWTALLLQSAVVWPVARWLAPS